MLISEKVLSAQVIVCDHLVVDDGQGADAVEDEILCDLCSECLYRYEQNVG